MTYPFPVGRLPAAGLNAALKLGIDLTVAWTSFPPSWTSSGTAPAIGNGTLEGAYLTSGKLVFYTGRLVAGSTTTFGTGNYNISAPIAPLATTVYPGAGLAFDSSSATGRAPLVTLLDTGTVLRFFGAVPTAGQIGATVPFTWAQSDQLVWSIVYEAA